MVRVALSELRDEARAGLDTMYLDLRRFAVTIQAMMADTTVAVLADARKEALGLYEQRTKAMLRSLSALYKANTNLMDERGHLTRALADADASVNTLSERLEETQRALARTRANLEVAQDAHARVEQEAREGGAAIATLQTQLAAAQTLIDQLDGVSLLDDDDVTQSSVRSDADASLPPTPTRTTTPRSHGRTNIASHRPSSQVRRPVQFKPKKRKRGRASSVPLSSIFDESTIEGARQRVRDQLRKEEP